MVGSRTVQGIHLWLILWKTQKVIEAKSFEHINSLSICISDFAVLEILLHKGDLPVNEIGKKVMLTSGSITTAVDRLEENGFLKRKEHSTDRRVKVVTLTAKGRLFIKKAFAEHKKAMENSFSTLSQTERVTLAKLLKKLGKSEKA